MSYEITIKRVQKPSEETIRNCAERNVELELERVERSKAAGFDLGLAYVQPMDLEETIYRQTVDTLDIAAVISSVNGGRNQ